MKVKIGDTVTVNPELLDAGEAAYGLVNQIIGDEVVLTDQNGNTMRLERWDVTVVDRIGRIEYVRYCTGEVSEDDMDWLISRVRRLQS